jgi:AcrR family transcriptional regulator
MAVVENETRSEILTAALALARKKGIAAVTMVAAAKAAKVTRQTVYFYFKSRAGLLADMMRHEDLSHPLAPRLFKLSNEPPSPRTYEAFVRTWFRFIQDVLTVAIAVQAESLHDPEALAAWRARQDVVMRMITRIIQGLADQGRLAAGWTVEDAAVWTLSQLDPARYYNIVRVRGWPAERMAERSLAALKLELLKA